MNACGWVCRDARAQFLSMSNVVPNFALDKVIKATQQIPHDKNSDLVMQVRALDRVSCSDYDIDPVKANTELE